MSLHQPDQKHEQSDTTLAGKITVTLTIFDQNL